MKKIYLGLAAAAVVFSSCQKLLMVDPESTLTQDDLQEVVKKNPDKVLEPMVTKLVSEVNGYSNINSVDTKNYSY